MIDVIVVEPHHHALEHIHHVIRQKTRKRKRVLSWTMVHFDSHPDLACPNANIPARLCFTPRSPKPTSSSNNNKNTGDGITELDNTIGKDLYDLLDMSQSGIAEWIMPLVLAGGLNTIYWLRHNWCDQFGDGQYKIPIGAWIPPQYRDDNGNDDDVENVVIECFLDLPEVASVKTSFQHAYFLDDNSVVPDNELLLKEKLNLIVCDSESGAGPVQGNYQTHLTDCIEDNSQEWILDVCLDYFICTNPFIAELERLDSNISNIILEAIHNLSHRQMTNSNSSAAFNEDQTEFYMQQSTLFQILARTFFENLGASVRCTPNLAIIDKYIFLNEAQYKKLYHLYEIPSFGQELWDDLVSLLISFDNKEDVSKLCELVINGLSCLTLPQSHDWDHQSTQLSSELQNRIDTFGDCLRHQRWTNNELCVPNIGRPSIITIARSSEDEFTPPLVVEALQEAVLHQIHSVYCNCQYFTHSRSNNDDEDRCAINLVLDYGEFEDQ